MYGGPMIKRTTINLDQPTLRAAARVLGTTRVTDTVHRAMEEVARRAQLEGLAELEFPDLDLEALESMRRPRFES